MAATYPNIHYCFKGLNNMKRFNFDENDDQEDEVDDFDHEGEHMSQEEYKVLIEEQQILQQLQYELSQQELEQNLLAQAVAVCEKAITWRFQSLETQLRKIAKAFKMMKKLTAIPDGDEEK